MTDSQTNEMDRLCCKVDFNIRYIKGTLNKVADALSRYYEHDYWTNMPRIHDYIQNMMIYQERTLEIEGQVIEKQS